ncbi:phosphopantothenoylcysteine decarboxylase [Verticillium alfalfae VaMs.102]|uniref:Phosphopantothenoylcysteine decarboxylase n=1 Tax=Verticillium alfalfae (strain VaMs.102 / ATCC MYA-4576 / FGSC 10136) TaxID=526221 RepID=C9S9E0_VERA1|nr:phosphopantothenoylcysteine decarboxylase [Verticillium alfalfae VaMs.102]EEY16003.1 phosphopantothenoylcysteine decarboxylase [Verticillium alfalfae VaMs.102]
MNPADAVAGALQDGKAHLLLACTGSVATIKLPSMLAHLARHPSLSVRIILTPSAAQFLTGTSAEQPTVESLRRLPGVDGVYLDADEWGPHPWKRGASILHIELRRWADLLVIAPLSANSLAKIAAGNVRQPHHVRRARLGHVRPPRRTRRRIVAAPSMNTMMYTHPLTARHLKVSRRDWGRPRRMVPTCCGLCPRCWRG